MIEEIINQEDKLAIIVRDNFNRKGTTFLTPNDSTQQLAFMIHPKGKVIEPHIHNNVLRQIDYTQEVLIIKSGKLKVDFYNDQKEYLKSTVLNQGDVILLMKGGHGFQVLEDLCMIEVKQGPYVGEIDKVKF